MNIEMKRFLLPIVLFGMLSLSHNASCSAVPADNTATLSEAQLEQLVAPIALYPDPLLAQVLMASTYPVEIVSATRWLATNNQLDQNALQSALKTQNWDESVKSLVLVPDVLNMLNQKIDMTSELGDAFLEQPQALMEAVQNLRSKAQAAGNLKSSKEQVVSVDQSTQDDGTADEASSVIIIMPADPQEIYVPVYDPSLIYGTWGYPEYPPYYYYPPGYAAGTLLAFTAGVAVGSALWGVFDWHHGNININADRYNSFYGTHITNNRWDHKGSVDTRSARRERIKQDLSQGSLQRIEPKASSLKNVESQIRDAAPRLQDAEPRLRDVEPRIRDEAPRMRDMEPRRGGGGFGGGGHDGRRR